MWHFSLLMNYAGMFQIKQAQIIWFWQAGIYGRERRKDQSCATDLACRKSHPQLNTCGFLSNSENKNTPISFQE